MRRRQFVATLGAGLAGAFVPQWPRLRREQFVERWSWAMGQAVHVVVFAESDDHGLDACARALAELRRVEDRLSLFDDASDLCELNRRRSMRADSDLCAVLRAASMFRQETAGAFDAAVEPLMRAWGFHRPRHDIPNDIEIAAAREAVATAIVRLSDNTVSLPSTHTQLDFGGIAVGYGIDRAIGVLRTAGIRRAFVDVSGDCYSMGAPPGEPAGWSVQIAGSARTVRLRDAALATSSNNESVIHLGRRVLGHVMDPGSGWPADTRRQVTVLARTAIAADALSTAALVSGRCAREALAMYTTAGNESASGCHR
jgi:thiamine biosynthesis lipoprotein